MRAAFPMQPTEVQDTSTISVMQSRIRRQQTIRLIEAKDLKTLLFEPARFILSTFGECPPFYSQENQHRLRRMKACNDTSGATKHRFKGNYIWFYNLKRCCGLSPKLQLLSPSEITDCCYNTYSMLNVVSTRWALPHYEFSVSHHRDRTFGGKEISAVIPSQGIRDQLIFICEVPQWSLSAKRH
ncbi:hypothetical protein TNCT_52581 [Trichonephila clavata]|uniref:Uncharacterized protein n=1 Tax=Trichonephila clavata TaxID=2740835 RepID=A0A8X6FF90_TRICU|nr:hypothetical protein TNCT_52581 [Trichonephila clavata]